MARSSLRDSWERRKARAFPPGAMTFHLAAWSPGELSCRRRGSRRGPPHGGARFRGAPRPPRDRVRVGGRDRSSSSVRGDREVDRVPPLVRLGDATLIEDGLVLVGEESGGVEAGRDRYARGAPTAPPIAALLRRARPSAAASGRPRAGRWRAMRRQQAPSQRRRQRRVQRRRPPRRRRGSAMVVRGSWPSPRRRSLFAPASSEPDSFRADGRGLAGIEDLGRARSSPESRPPAFPARTLAAQS